MRGFLLYCFLLSGSFLSFRDINRVPSFPSVTLIELWWWHFFPASDKRRNCSTLPRVERVVRGDKVTCMDFPHVSLVEMWLALADICSCNGTTRSSMHRLMFHSTSIEPETINWFPFSLNENQEFSNIVACNCTVKNCNCIHEVYTIYFRI